MRRGSLPASWRWPGRRPKGLPGPGEWSAPPLLRLPPSPRGERGGRGGNGRPPHGRSLRPAPAAGRHSDGVAGRLVIHSGTAGTAVDVCRRRNRAARHPEGIHPGTAGTAVEAQARARRYPTGGEALGGRGTRRRAAPVHPRLHPRPRLRLPHFPASPLPRFPSPPLAPLPLDPAVAATAGKQRRLAPRPPAPCPLAPARFDGPDKTKAPRPVRAGA
jgi:hypothetical protein